MLALQANGRWFESITRHILWRVDMKKIGGYICDDCRTFFTHKPITAQGKKRVLHFCTLKHKGKYLKIVNPQLNLEKNS